MANSINKVILIGRLGTDPDLRYTPQGTAVARFSLATNDRWKDKQTGDLKEKTVWHKIVVWGKMGETITEYLGKGRQVYIEGRIDNRSWEDNEGQKRYITEVVANQIVFLGGRGEASQSSTDENEIPTDSLTDDDIPF